MKRILTILSAITIISCGGGGDNTPTAPSATPAPTASTFALSGSVRDSQNTALSSANVRILDGPAANRSTTTDTNGNYSLSGLTPAGFNIRFSQTGYTSVDRGVNLTADTRVDVNLAAIPAAPTPPSAPSAPSGLAVSVSGNSATLRWNAVSTATDYLILIGTSQSSSNSLSTNTSQTSFAWNNVSSGTYYARVQARNATGSSESSNEAQFTVGTTSGGGGGGTGGGGGGTGGGGGIGTCSGPSSAACGTPTARCNDGTYSCSRNRSGTCSTHSGVACWICPGALCSGLTAPNQVAAHDESASCLSGELSPEEWLRQGAQE